MIPIKASWKKINSVLNKKNSEYETHTEIKVGYIHKFIPNVHDIREGKEVVRETGLMAVFIDSDGLVWWRDSGEIDIDIKDYKEVRRIQCQHLSK